jgi:arylsulfatase A-like enzyme
MVEHDGHVGELLDLVDELGVTKDTIVVYTTDNVLCREAAAGKGQQVSLRRV